MKKLTVYLLVLSLMVACLFAVSCSSKADNASEVAELLYQSGLILPGVKDGVIDLVPFLEVFHLVDVPMIQGDADDGQAGRAEFFL